MRSRYAFLFSIVVILTLLIFQATYFVVGKQSSTSPIEVITLTSQQGVNDFHFKTPTPRPSPTPRPTPTHRPSPTPRPTLVPPPPPPQIPSFEICPSGVGHSRCYIDWNALFRWLCQHNLMSRADCRKLGY